MKPSPNKEAIAAIVKQIVDTHERRKANIGTNGAPVDPKIETECASTFADLQKQLEAPAGNSSDATSLIQETVPEENNDQAIARGLRAVIKHPSSVEHPDYRARLSAAMTGIRHGVGPQDECLKAAHQCCREATITWNGTVRNDHKTRLKAFAFLMKMRLLEPSNNLDS